MPASTRLLVPFAIAASAAPAAAQSIDWRLASGHGMAACQMVYDSARDRCVAVGEWPSLVQPFATAEWDGTRWRARMMPTAPTSRSGFGLAYDAGHKRVVLFGGALPPSGQLIDDTWEYDGLAWIARSPAVRPPARRQPAMTQDLVRGRVLLAGGVGASSTILVDTWSWDGTTWQNASARIPQLSSVAMAAHPPTQQIVLVGNNAGRGETWTFDGTSWTQAAAAATPFGATYRMTRDGARNRLVMLAAESATPWQWNGSAWSPFAAPFDGRRDCGLAADGAGRVLAFAGLRVLPGTFGLTLPLDDTWQIDDAGHVRLDGGGPIDVQAPKIAWDATRSRLVCVGTASPTSMPNETWEFDGSTWHALAAPTPSPAIEACVCFDLLRGRTVRFGGGRTNFLSFFPTAELSEWDGTQWHVLPASGPPRMNHAMTHDLTRGGVLVFGGSGPNGLVGDTWKWDGANWTQLAVIGPPPRANAGLAFDPFRSCAVLFGGQTSTLGVLLGDTWEWDGLAWHQMAPATSPSPRQRALIDYDPARQRTVLMGGLDNSGGLHDAWEWDGSNWQQVATSVPEILPSPSLTAVMAGDHWLLVSQGATWFGHPAAARTSLVGTGCGGTSAPALRADGDPVLGNTFAAELHHAAQNAPFLLGLGTGRASTPIGSGCTIYVPQLDAVLQGTTGRSGFAAVSLTVPPVPQLLGIEVSLQAAPRDLGAALGFALTNAVVARIGR